MNSAKAIPAVLAIVVALVIGCEGVPELFKEEASEEYHGSEPCEMVLIPAGEFTMGSDFSENPDFQDGIPDEGFSDEHPEHTVYLSDYYIDITEVTNSQYRSCVLAGVCSEPAITNSRTHEDYYISPEFDNYPVVNVTWFQAETYCRWAGKRLPTEAEWEKAARGDADERNYPWGNEPPTCDLANYGEVIELDDGSTQTGCVGDADATGARPSGASPYGVMDMAGNVAEWVADWYDENYYNPDLFPDNSSNPKGPPTGSVKVVRGGSFADHAYFIRVPSRGHQNPYLGLPQIGFRCAKSAGD